MVSSAGACEGNWSSYDFIHCKKRNKLTPERANDLVYIFNNLQLVGKIFEPEKFAEWVSEVDEDQLQALLDESKEVLEQVESDELLKIAQGVAEDDDEVVDAGQESD